MALIDVGSPAINRDAYMSFGRTYIVKDNSANEDGKITSVDLYTRQALSGCIIATFYLVSGETFCARDSQYIGNVPGWSKQTISELDIEIKAGDLIGLYFSVGAIESDESGFAGVWDVGGDHTTGEAYYNLISGDTISLYGTGETVVVGIKWNGVTISKWNGRVITKLN